MFINLNARAIFSVTHGFPVPHIIKFYIAFKKLLDVLSRLVDLGNTVVVIEHNLDVIKTADWIIDLGPEGGDGGGQIVATGTPEEVAGVEGNHTGRYLREVLDRNGSD